MVDPVFARIRSHDFHPLEAERRTFTVDRVLQQPGVADLDDTDGRVRVLAAVRGLTAFALRDPLAVAQGLFDEHRDAVDRLEHVGYPSLPSVTLLGWPRRVSAHACVA